VRAAGAGATSYNTSPGLGLPHNEKKPPRPAALLLPPGSFTTSTKTQIRA
jgi:hypothetical protein